MLIIVEMMSNIKITEKEFHSKLISLSNGCLITKTMLVGTWQIINKQVSSACDFMWLNPEFVTKRTT